MRIALVPFAAIVSAALACGGPAEAPAPQQQEPAAAPRPASPPPTDEPGPVDGGTPAPPAPDPAPPPPAARPPPAPLAATPPMGWNDWAHYQCWISEQIILDNAAALVSSSLSKKGYDTVTVDDCWMAGSRDANGDLVADSAKFPHGMAWLGAQLHAMGLKFGIYEDAGATTCGGYPGSGQPDGGAPDHFAQDARLFASWGVDYLKLDGCFVWIPPGKSKEQAYRDAYSAQSAALAASGRTIVFSESTPAYFQHDSNWDSVLGWVGRYGQLWRLGEDIQIYDAWNPSASRWASVLNNYGYTRDKGRFTHPGNWNDPDFIIGGDPGISAEEARSQFSLWAMMSAPLILSSDLTNATQATAAMLGNSDVIAIDQDALGEPAAVTVGSAVDVLIKRLDGGDRAVAFFNHGSGAAAVSISADQLGFDACSDCTYHVKNLWDGASPAQISAMVPSHGTALFRVSQTH
ncbi:MAG: glycoside hydrolase family 27 protein [Myxococcales bacterium]|nr:glycoside hydrolase family 27 protein [Myxococcales bacterium]